MTVAGGSSQNGTRVVAKICVLGAAVTVALLSAHSYAGGWNDGSRLATVECLVDYHTLAIDDSIFVRVPPATDPKRALPYPKADSGLLQTGTGDKLFINGHYYSDKSPVPALVMAGMYEVYAWCTGRTAREHADSFCYWMTVASSGLAYVVAVWCMFLLAGCLRLPLLLQLGFTASFGLATVALPYVRHANNHIFLLALLAALLLSLVRLKDDAAPPNWLRLFGVGLLMGLAYTVDLGAGPVILMCTIALVAYRFRSVAPVLVPVLSAMPWLVLHHIVNYMVGGTFKPANAVPEYFNWPGCTFNAQNMTGGWNHPSLGQFLIYAVALLDGKHGFLGHNLPLFLAIPAIFVLLQRKSSELPERLYASCCCGGIWLAYALTSNNYSGQCCSVRWFVPLLAPGYYILGLLLRDDRRSLGTFLILSAWGALEGMMMWCQGPWTKHMVPLFWQLQGGALLTALAYTFWSRRRISGTLVSARDESNCQTKAA